VIRFRRIRSRCVERLRSRSLVLGGLAASTVWSGIAQIVPMVVSIATVPILISHLGLNGYGVWALINTLIIFAVNLDGGIGIASQRFFSLYLSRDDMKNTFRLATTLTAAAIGFAALIYALGPVIAQITLMIVHVPQSLQLNTTIMLRNLGVLVLLILLSNILSGYLRAVDRFRAIALSAILANLGFLVGLLYVGNRLTIMNVFVLMLLQIGMLDVLLAISARSFLKRIRLQILHKTELIGFWSYAWRTQITNASSLAVVQTDAIFVASMLPIEQLAYLAIGSQVAMAVRSVPMFVLPPLLSRLTHVFGSAGEAGVTQLANLQNRRWVLGIGAYAGIAIPAVAFIVRSWAGPYPAAELVAVILMVGNGFNLLTGVATLYCSAIGRPGLVARYGLGLLVGNMVLSWPCTYLWGLAGAVGSTAVVQVLASAYFYVVIRRNLPAFDTALSCINLFRIGWLSVLTFGLVVGSLLLAAPSVIALGVTAAGVAVALGVAVWSASRDGGWGAPGDEHSNLHVRAPLQRDAQG
jgi:O-antigen/teichoic acid export membrane protein